MVDDFMSFVEQLSFWQNSDLSQPNQPSPTILAMPNAEVLYYPGLFEASESDALLAELQQIIPWQQEVIRLYVNPCRCLGSPLGMAIRVQLTRTLASRCNPYRGQRQC